MNTQTPILIQPIPKKRKDANGMRRQASPLFSLRLCAFRPLRFLPLLLPFALSGLADGVPEPGLVMYGQGHDTTSMNLLTNGTITWTVNPVSGGAPVTVSAPLTNIGSLFSYVLTVPFETDISSGLPIDATAAPDADSDGDGQSDRAEFRAGTNPMQASDVLGVSAAEDVGRGEAVSFRTVLGKSYWLERNDDFPGGAWVPVGSVVIGNGEAVLIVDTDAATLPKGVYRVRIVE